MDLQRPNDVIRSLESDPQRKQQEIIDLKSRLTAETQGEGEIARIAWLFSHLEDYLDTWTACITVFSMSDFVHNDLHVILTIGVDLIDEELLDLSGCNVFKEKWKDFASTVRSINNETSKDIGQELATKFECVRKVLISIGN